VTAEATDVPAPTLNEPPFDADDDVTETAGGETTFPLSGVEDPDKP